MEAPFDVTAWQPTRPREPGESDLSSELPTLISSLNAQTKDIYRSPYDPERWLWRSVTLAQLRYPELAVGDAYKAMSLCRTLIARLEDSRWRLGHRLGFWMLDDVRNDGDIDELEQRIADIQSEAHRIETENLYHFPAYEEGRYLQRPYPWMHARHRVRDEKLVATLNKEFAVQAFHQGRHEADCMVQCHAFGNFKTTSGDSSDILGVFATRDLPNDTLLVVDQSRTWGCIGPGLGGSTANLHGGSGCSDPLHPNMPSDDTTEDLRWVRERAGRHAAELILRCRLLLCCTQDSVAHPLDHPLIARLTPTYRRKKMRLFSLEHDILIPSAWLQQLGIDIFAHPAYDTWVLFTLQAREENNSWSDPCHSCISPLFSLFNHSCEPNVRWAISDDKTTLKLRTTKDVGAGEQLFVDYDSYMEDKPLQERRKRMRKWLDAECQCTRCVAEERAAATSGKGRRMRATGGNGVASWDTADKPVLPEDPLRAVDGDSGVEA